MSPSRRKELGEILIENNLLLPEQLEVARERSKSSGSPLGHVLVDIGFVSDEDLLAAECRQGGTPYIRLRKGLVDPKAVGVLPREKAEAYCAIPMFRVHDVLTLAMADSTNPFIMDDVRSLTGCRVQPVQCGEQAVRRAIEEYYSETLEMSSFIESFQESDVEVVESQYQRLELVTELAEGAKIINIVNMLLLNAVKEGASDIHIEPDLRQTRVRYRIDGALQEVMSVKGDFHSAIVSRVKVIAKLDIAERRLPQDGRIHILAEGREVDLRVSSMPTVLGEKIVIRVLDRGRMVLDINEIGLDNACVGAMKELLTRPNGMILVTGPTGSGKTTTLYSGLTFISSIEKNIVSIEDPVEYQLALINQIQVNEEQQLTFARILRSVLRQDPNVIMVGEIRDKDTAEVAIRAALTGHLVVTTLHTNESAGAIPRLVEMGLEPYLLTSAVIAVVAQRLLRLVCQNCKTTYFPPPQLLQRIGWAGANTSFVSGKGCDRCFDSGLRNRTSIFELLVMTDALRDHILRNPTLQSIREYCVQQGMRTMRDEAFRLVEEGKTALEEALRIVGVEDDGRTAPGEA